MNAVDLKSPTCMSTSGLNKPVEYSNYNSPISR